MLELGPAGAKFDAFFLTSAPAPSRALVWFAALAGVLHLDKLLLGPDAAIRFFDTFDSEFPRIVNLARDLVEFGLVEWYPNVAGGLPVNAFHFTLAHPLVLLSTILPPWLIHNALIVTYALLGGYGFYRLVTVFFGITHATALLSGTLFVLITQFHFDALIFAPFFLAFPMFFVLLHAGQVEAASSLRRLTRALALAGLCLLSYPILGLVKFTLLHGAVLLLHFYWHRQFGWRMAATALLFWAGYGLIFLPNYLALADIAPFAQREYPDASFDWVTGILGYVLVELPVRFLNGLLTIAKSMRLTMFVFARLLLTPYSRLVRATLINLLLFLLATVFVLSPLQAIFAGTVAQQIDLYHLNWVLPFCTMLYLAAALDELQRRGDTERRRFLALFLGLTFASFVAEAAAMSFGLEALRAYSSFVFFGLFALFWLRASSPEAWRFSVWGGAARLNAGLGLAMLLAAILAGPVLRVELGSYTAAFSPHPVLQAFRERAQVEPFRIAVLGIHPAQAQMAGLETFGGRSPLFYGAYKDYAALILAPQLETESARRLFRKNWYEILLNEWQGARRLTPERASPVRTSDWNLPLLAAMNVRYILSSHPVPGLEEAAEFAAMEHPAEARYGRLRVYPLDGAKARGYLVPEAEVLATERAVLERLAETDEEGLSRTVFLTGKRLEPLRDPDDTPRECGAVELRRYAPDRLAFEVEARRACLLVISNNFDPGWRAQIDGRAAPIYRANQTFMMVQVPGPGRYEARLDYDDPRVPTALSAMPAGILLIVLSVMAGRVRPHSAGNRTDVA